MSRDAGHGVGEFGHAPRHVVVAGDDDQRREALSRRPVRGSRWRCRSCRGRGRDRRSSRGGVAVPPATISAMRVAADRRVDPGDEEPLGAALGEKRERAVDPRRAAGQDDDPVGAGVGRRRGLADHVGEGDEADRRAPTATTPAGKRGAKNSPDRHGACVAPAPPRGVHAVSSCRASLIVVRIVAGKQRRARRRAASIRLGEVAGRR